MTGLIAKLIVCPLSIAICNFVTKLGYASGQAVFIGFVLAFFTHFIELFILSKGTLWINTVVDFITIFTIIYLSQFFLNDVSINTLSALLTALFISGTELFLHDCLLKAGKVKKAED